MVYGIIKDAELILKSSGVQQIGSENGAGLKVGPTGSVKAVIIVSDVGSGGTLDVQLEESDDDGDGDPYAALVILPQIVEAGVKTQNFRSEKTYVRRASTVGTDAVTWEMFITTAEK
jgi:hypothetical protein